LHSLYRALSARTAEDESRVCSRVAEVYEFLARPTPILEKVPIWSFRWTGLPEVTLSYVVEVSLYGVSEVV